MMKPVAVALLLTLPLVASSAHADTVTTEADTLVVVTPNAPVIVQQGGAAAPVMAPGAAPAAPVVAATPAAANGAPQNEDWSNVSHINGVPVKVGERGDYLYRFRKTNISANPFGLFFGYYDIAASHALSNNLAASVAITGWSMGGGSSSGYQMSATLPLYFRRAFSGPFLEGGLLYRADTDNDYYAYGADCYDCSGYSSMSTTSSWIGPQLMFGWHWTFDSGLNIAAAFGVAKRMANSDEYGSDEDANGYFRVGYAF